MNHPTRSTRGRSSRSASHELSNRPAPAAECLESRVLLSASLVQDLNPGTLGSSLSPVFALGSHNFFYTNYPAPSFGSSQLWETDGTDAGTVPATDLAAKLGRGIVSTPTAFTGSTYFIDGSQLWKSDGTAAGTSAVTTVGTGPSIDGVAGNKLILNDGGTLLAFDSAGQSSVLRNVSDNYARFTEASDDSKIYFLRGDYVAHE